MGLCRLMIFAHIYAVRHEECHLHRVTDYDDYNLREGINFARIRLSDGFTNFPHDREVDCRTFIKWAKNQRKLLQQEEEAKRTLGLGVQLSEIAEQIGIPIDRWMGKCYLVALKMLEFGIVDGELVTGYYHKGDFVTDHCWIKLDDKRICDPTRWTLDNVKPRIYIGEMTPEYDENGERWQAELDKISEPFKNKHYNLSEELDRILAKEGI